MNPTWNADSLVAVHSKNVDRYKRNFLRQAVCELRFPTLMELGEPRPPASFVKALRKKYTSHELANEVTLGIGSGTAGTNHKHVFRSSKLTWAVSLKQNSVSIETNSYTEFANMRERVLEIVEAASKIIDSDFFTRVGLRYINVIDPGVDPLDGWVNPDLVNPLLSRNFTGVQDYVGRLQLAADDGGCLLQHGLRFPEQRRKEEIVSPGYLLDIDTFRNEVSLNDTDAALAAMHTQAFDIFDWAIGPKTCDYLSL